ncbi:hypothetical protein [uncultured Thiohalocapsa sp.]|uniref:hypothetical protein n=1 Tax=uncultured Thiohalocapsa sp. TaxID=768990 RepID=UPI0025D85ED2|nr:hypothetical protein [uncultured Thiohalocapsa sp.]
MAAIVRRRPALAMVTGDFVYGPTDEDMDDVREEWRESELIPSWDPTAATD